MVASEGQTLTEQTLALLLAFLERGQEDGITSPMSPLRSLVQTMEDGLGGLLPDKYFLSALDPGQGKTSAVCHFIKAWKDRGFTSSSSVLIALSRIEEIKTYVQLSGLSKGDFGVLTTDDGANGLGLPSHSHGEARVLFTTQQMIDSRTKGRSFTDASEFHFRGQPRNLRLWDEEFSPDEPTILYQDELSALLGPLRPKFPEFVESLEKLIEAFRTSEPGVLPSALQASFKSAPSYKDLTDAGVRRLSQANLGTLKALGSIDSTSASLVSDPSYGLILIGSRPRVPRDFAPAIILDASGRVKETYSLWEKHRGNLVRLPAAVNDYSYLEINVWETASGKDTLETEEGRAKFLRPIADEINTKSKSRWLIIHKKDNGGELVIPELRSLVTANAAERVVGLTWGRHHGTNAFRDFSNVVILGQQTYRETDYLALAHAASGLPVAAISAEDIARIREGEYKHHLLQALCRGSTRKSRYGFAGHCNVYLITSPRRGLPEILRGMFPGVELRGWQEREVVLSGRIGEAAGLLREAFGNPEVSSIPKQAVRNAMGMKTQTFSKSVLAKPTFHQFLTGFGLAMTNKAFVRTRVDQTSETLDTISEF